MRSPLALLVAVSSLVCCLACCGCQSAAGGGCEDDSSQTVHRTIMPDQVQWQNNPPTLPPGAQMAVLEGDPTKPGFFTIRGHFPDGYRIPPHFHPNYERVTVLSGTLYLANGDRFDESAGQALTAGSYST